MYGDKTRAISFTRQCRHISQVRWTTKLSCNVKLCQEFWCQKLLNKIRQLFLNLQPYMRTYTSGCFFLKHGVLFHLQVVHLTVSGRQGMHYTKFVNTVVIFYTFTDRTVCFAYRCLLVPVLSVRVCHSVYASYPPTGPAHRFQSVCTVMRPASPASKQEILLVFCVRYC